MYVCMTDTECCLIFYPMKNAYTINAMVTQRTGRNVYAQVAKHSQLFVIVVHVSHPAEQCTIDNL